MWKRIFILVILTLSLSSCFGWDTWVVDNSKWLTITWNKDFTIWVPNSWQIIEQKDSILPRPNKWNIELAVIAKDEKNSFKNNLLILSDKLGSFTTSKEFAILNNIWASKDYIDYKKLDSKEITFSDGEVSIVYIFEAKYNLDTPKIKFLQTSHICDQTKVFLLTIAISNSIKDTSKYEQLLSTFECKTKKE